MLEPDDLFEIHPGDAPLMLSIPHSGLRVPDSIAGRLTEAAGKLPDSDWHVDRLYDFAGELDATVITANYSRYVVDLNRPPGGESLYPGQATTGTCPDVQFDGTPLYLDGSAVSEAECEERVEACWKPYHARIASELARIRAKHGHAVLYDCHSIASRVPRLFEGTLPVLNLGSARGASADEELVKSVAEIMLSSGYTMAVNGRFVGGHITRSFGRPPGGVHALQMELGQDAYLADGPGYHWHEEKAGRLKLVLRQICEMLARWRP